MEVRVAEVRPVSSQPDDPLFAAILSEMGGTRGWSVVMRKPEADSLHGSVWPALTRIRRHPLIPHAGPTQLARVDTTRFGGPHTSPGRVP